MNNRQKFYLMEEIRSRRNSVRLLAITLAVIVMALIVLSRFVDINLDTTGALIVLLMLAAGLLFSESIFDGKKTDVMYEFDRSNAETHQIGVEYIKQYDLIDKKVSDLLLTKRFNASPARADALRADTNTAELRMYLYALLSENQLKNRWNNEEYQSVFEFDELKEMIDDAVVNIQSNLQVGWKSNIQDIPGGYQFVYDHAKLVCEEVIKRRYAFLRDLQAIAG